MSAAFLRVPLAVTFVAERDAVADAVREVRSFTYRFDMVRNDCCHRPAIPLAVLTEVLVSTHDHG